MEETPRKKSITIKICNDDEHCFTFKVADVGGGLGINLNLITSKYPHLHGINFDLPHVIEHVPTYVGMEHVGGDMFESVPHGDAIFMKYQSWDSHLSEGFSPGRERLTWDSEILGYTEGFSPERELARLSENGLAWARVGSPRRELASLGEKSDVLDQSRL
ncbi:hypothetical protein Lal_00049334 [Lupinus albus]|nr:hypothetical protein Lal_00049334 [Lupinus albus]